jgi:tetratricopeptide (TPR) repeat protein
MNISPHKPLARPRILWKRLFQYERCGKYEEGLAETREFWPDTNFLPNFEGLEARDAAELLLRCGSLFGYLGHKKQLPNAQEKSKNLLTEARNRFLDIYDIEKVAECENYIALSYWRLGEMNEAETYAETALSHDLPSTNAVRLYSIIILTIVQLATKRFEQAARLLGENEYDFVKCDDPFLLGSFSSHMGIALNKIGQGLEALGRFKAARMYHQRSGHEPYLAMVDNNLALTYKAHGKFDLAHSASDSAAGIFGKLKNRNNEGFSLDTKAGIYIAEGKYEEAVQMADKALGILQKGDNTFYRIETLMTKVRALVFLGDISEAAFCLSQAVGLALEKTGEDSARKLTQRFDEALSERASQPHGIAGKSAAAPARAGAERSEPASKDDAGLQLVLPPALAHYTDFQGVWINGGHLEKAGLQNGSLAVVVNEPVEPGDLIAVAGTDTELVSCGIFSTGFGMVSLEGLDGSPSKLFDEKEIKILGRIVGVCNSGKDPEGKMIVEEVDIEYAKR